MSNPFASAEAWEASGDTILTAGDHVVKVNEVDGGGNSSGGYPQIELRLGNEQGTIRDWIVVIPSTIGKVVQLTDAAGLPRPDDSEITQEGQGWRIDASYLDQLYGKTIGVILRDEPDRNDPSRMRTRVKGYVPASQLGSDIPPAGNAFEPDPLSGFGTAKPADDDIPF